MSEKTPSPMERQMNLLKQMEGRGLKRGSDLLESQADIAPSRPRSSGEISLDDVDQALLARFKTSESSPAARECQARRRREAFDRLWPHAARLRTPEGGLCWLVETQCTLDGAPSSSGHICPSLPWANAGLIPPSPCDLAVLTGDPAWAELDPTRILYLDTETTGLATGAGTYAFLIGIGRWQPDPGGDPHGRMVVEQYFLDDYDGEPAMVAALDRQLSEAQALVTYNGRAFDVPLLETRWRMQRVRPRFPSRHLDLLYFARRLWRRRLDSCSLGSVESAILSIERASDVPGALVPGIYLDCLRGAHLERLVPVFDHHAQDIYSLAALASALTRAAVEPDDPRFSFAEDQWGLARLFEDCGRIEEALVRLEWAVLTARDEEFGFWLAMQLARRYKRLGRWQEAIEIWQARAAQARPGRLEPLVELAKYAEHRVKDFVQARQWTEQALRLVDQHVELGWVARYEDEDDLMPPPHATDRDALEHRLNRVRGKADRAKR